MCNEEKVKSQKTSPYSTSLLEPIFFCDPTTVLFPSHCRLIIIHDLVCHPVICKGRLSSRSHGSMGKREIHEHNQCISFLPILAFETMGPINGAGKDFISGLGHRISDLPVNPCKTSFLFQCMSVALQRSFQLAFVENVALPYVAPATVLFATYEGNEGC
jgi:hypothetical protein